MVFTSACAITGNVLAYNKNRTKKKPMVPINIPTSTNVGSKRHHDEGRCPLLNTMAMISKRSNHIPILMAIEIKNDQTKLLLIFLIKLYISFPFINLI